MTSIDNIVNDPGWQLSSEEPITASHIQVRIFDLLEHVTNNVIVEVMALENGLLYAVAKDNNRMPVLARGSYRVENFPKGHSPYQLINLIRIERENVRGFGATFEYKSGKTPEGHDAARIEYTTWHDSANGLTLLTSAQAYQAIEKGWIDLQLSLPTYENSSRDMTMEISSLGESLKFNKDGTFLEKPVPQLFWSSKELERVYQTVINGAQINPLQTAVAVINGFPSQRPLHIEKLVQYTNPIQKK